MPRGRASDPLCQLPVHSQPQLFRLRLRSHALAGGRQTGALFSRVAHRSIPATSLRPFQTQLAVVASGIATYV